MVSIQCRKPLNKMTTLSIQSNTRRVENQVVNFHPKSSTVANSGENEGQGPPHPPRTDRQWGGRVLMLLVPCHLKLGQTMGIFYCHLDKNSRGLHITKQRKYNHKIS